MHGVTITWAVTVVFLGHWACQSRGVAFLVDGDSEDAGKERVDTQCKVLRKGWYGVLNQQD